MLWYKKIKVAISVPAPPGTRGPLLTQSWSVTVTIPEEMRISPIFLAGVYEDLSTFVGIKAQQNLDRFRERGDGIG